MGTHGASGYRSSFIGSITYQVIKYAACPILTIPLWQKFTSFKNVLFPIRPITGALSRCEIVSQFMSSHSTLQVLCLSHGKSEREAGLLDKITAEVRPQLEKNNVAIRAQWGSVTSMAEEVLQSAYQMSSELIVITPAVDITTKQSFIGPHAQKILSNSKVPVLSLKKIFTPAFA
jgi:hypothetical protein